MRIYLAVAISAIVFGAYLAGMQVGRAKCMLATVADSAHVQMQTIKQMEKINAETLYTGTRDIRRVLRAQYTIAD